MRWILVLDLLKLKLTGVIHWAADFIGNHFLD